MLESGVTIAIVAALVGFFLWRERQEKRCRKQSSDAGEYVADSGGWWGSGWGGDSCGGADGGGCGGD